jgi:hypothetical protein
MRKQSESVPRVRPLRSLASPAPIELDKISQQQDASPSPTERVKFDTDNPHKSQEPAEEAARVIPAFAVGAVGRDRALGMGSGLNVLY